MSRAFAIVVDSGSMSYVADLVSKLDGKVYVLSSEDVSSQLSGDYNSVLLPQLIDTYPKQYNYAILYVKSLGKHDYLHIIMPNTQIVSNIHPFVDDVETMMKCLGLHDWFSTTCDLMNYVFTRYNPSMTVALDAEGIAVGLLTELSFTSHANTLWTVVDLSAPDDDVKLCEEFTIPMFYIIEHLAQRRNKHPISGMDFMNMYPTVKSELGVFTNINDKQDLPKQTDMQLEDALFKSKNIDYSSTGSVDLVLSRLYETIKK